MSEVVKNKIVFKATIDGKEHDLAVVRPDPKQLNEGQKHYNRAFREALDSKALLRLRVDEELKAQGLWDDEKQAELDSLNKQYKDNEIKLARGKMSLDDGRKIALKMRQLRSDINAMLSNRNALDSHTAEAQAEGVRFNYLVSVCTVYNTTGKLVFDSLEDYLSKATETYAFEAGNNLATLIYSLDPDFEKKQPENAFLLKYKFFDKDLRLVDKLGRLIDDEGRLINNEGRFITEDGEYCDKYGHLVDKEGQFIVKDAGPFFDDNGQEVS